MKSEGDSKMQTLQSLMFALRSEMNSTRKDKAKSASACIAMLFWSTLTLIGCGGGMQAINQLPPPPPVLPQIDGTYVITLEGFNLKPGQAKPAFTLTIKQDAWSGDTAKLEISGSGNTSFCAAPGTQWAVDGNLTKADALTITVSNAMQPPQTVLTLSTPDFSTLAGKWTPGPAMVSCNGFDSTGTDFTWKAVKQ